MCKESCYTDHKNIKYGSLGEMCEAYGITPVDYCNRDRLGWSKDKILETPVNKRYKKCKDHLGKEYGSLKEMCKAWKIPYSNYKVRRNLNWSVKDALTIPLDSDSLVDKDSDIGVCDHNGVRYKNMSAMCRAYGQDRKMVKNRLDLGWELERALTGPKFGKREEDEEDIESRTDHLGNVYRSINEMCKAYKINMSTYKYRRNNGYSKKQALLGRYADEDENIVEQREKEHPEES